MVIRADVASARSSIGEGESHASDVFDLLGYRARVHTPPGDAAAWVRAVLRGFGPVPADEGRLPRFDIAGGPGDWTIRVDDLIIHTDESLSGALSMLEWQLVSAALGHRLDLFHVHGAALCLPAAPRGVVLIGGSGRGKTTMTLGLMMRGFVPFSDDVVLVDPEGLLLRSLPRAFHIEEDAWRVLEPVTGPLARGDADPPGYFVPPQWAVTPVPIGWVLMTEYRPNQAPALQPLPPAHVAAALLEQSASLARAPRLALATARRIAEQARCYRFLVGDPLESIALVQQLTAATAGQ